MTVAELDPVMETEEGFEVPYHVALTTYLSYGILFIIGSLRDFYRTIVRSGKKAAQVCLCYPSDCSFGSSRVAFLWDSLFSSQNTVCE
jgi:hypothetical protein